MSILSPSAAAAPCVHAHWVQQLQRLLPGWGVHSTLLPVLPCRSFEIQYSYDRQTATDTVHAVAALLETPPQGHEDTPVERFW